MCLSHTSFVPFTQTKIPPHREPFCKARRHSTLSLTTNARQIESVSPRAQHLASASSSGIFSLICCRHTDRCSRIPRLKNAHTLELTGLPCVNRIFEYLRWDGGPAQASVHSSSGNEICRSALLSFETNCLHPKSLYIVDLTDMPRIGRHCLSGARPQMCRRLQNDEMNLKIALPEGRAEALGGHVSIFSSSRRICFALSG